MLATRQVARPAAVLAQARPVPRLAFWNAAASPSLHAFGIASVTLSDALLSPCAVLASPGEVPRQTVFGSPESLPDWIDWRHFSIVLSAVFEYLAPALATPFWHASWLGLSTGQLLAPAEPAAPDVSATRATSVRILMTWFPPRWSRRNRAGCCSVPSRRASRRNASWRDGRGPATHAPCRSGIRRRSSGSGSCPSPRTSGGRRR